MECYSVKKKKKKKKEQTNALCNKMCVSQNTFLIEKDPKGHILHYSNLVKDMLKQISLTDI